MLRILPVCKLGKNASPGFAGSFEGRSAQGGLAVARGSLNVIDGFTWMIARGLSGKEVKNMETKRQPTRELLHKHLEMYRDAVKRGEILVNSMPPYTQCTEGQKIVKRGYDDMLTKAKGLREGIEGLFLDLDSELPKETADAGSEPTPARITGIE